MLWLSLLLPSMKMRSKLRALVWPQHKIMIFQTLLVTCKNEEDPLKNNGARVATTFSHYKSMGIFPDAQGQLNPQSEVEPSRNSNSSDML